MMAMPSCEIGDLLLAMWAESLLFFPEVYQFSSFPEIVFHLEIEAFLEVGFPCGVIRVRTCSDFDMPFNWRIRCPGKIDPCCFFFSNDLSEEDPVPVTQRTTIFLLYPSSPFLWVPS